VGQSVDAEVEALRAQGEASEAGPALARLDRLLDLLDAARFSGDSAPRDAMWEALGGHVISRGHEATREALTRLLQEAWAVEDQHPDLGEDSQRFLADFIMLISVDLNRPTDADSLAIRTLAYRDLANSGHPRLVDNARWRLYDHVRGVLEGALEAPADRRVDVAVHALYAEREDVAPWLEDLAPHSRPPFPGPGELWELLQTQIDALAANPRWKPILERREGEDQALHDTVLALLPEPRDPTWALVRAERGTGRPESLAPVLLLEPGRAVVEPARPDSQSLSAISEQLPRAIERVVARDGRGTLLVAADPLLPSPELSGALSALATARVSVAELALHEPRVDDEERDVVVALPLQISRPDDLGAGARAFQDARIRVHLDGRGPRVWIDGAWLAEKPTSAESVADLMRRVRHAYPRERIVGLTMAGNVLHQQLIDLLIVLEGTTNPMFQAVGWLVGTGELPPEDGKADPVLVARGKLFADSMPDAELDQPFPLTKADQKRLELLASDLRTCLPELEGKSPKGGLRLDLQFHEGRLAEVRVAKAVRKTRREPIRTCATDVAYGFRLREHRDPISIGVVLRPPS
jgi:hypothetical protein